MTTAKTRRRTPVAPAPSRGLRARLGRVARHTPDAIAPVGAALARAIARLPGALRAAWAGADSATGALQTLPDPALRWVAASSMGLGLGLRLAGAPRLVVAAGVAPGLLASAAIVLRPVEPASTPVIPTVLVPSLAVRPNDGHSS
jgi:hypothetical protein